MGKVGILTTLKVWINEEVSVIEGGRMFKIRVMEYIDEWSPFSSGPFPYGSWNKKASPPVP